MKYTKNLIILLLCLYFLSSCSSLKNSIDNPNRVILNNSNFKLIEGRYSIHSIDNKGRNLEWYILGSSLSYLFRSNDSDSSRCVIFEFANEKTLNISYTNNSGKLKLKTVNGKLKNGYFVFKRTNSLIPMIFTNLYRNSKFRIGLLTNGNLITDCNQISIGTAMIIFPFYMNDKYFDIEFERINNE